MRHVRIYLLLMTVLIFAACSQEAEPTATAESTTAAPTPEEPTAAPPTATEIVPTETLLPPTELPPSPTPLPPTEEPPSPTPLPPTAEPSAEPTAVLEESIINQPEAIIGTWNSLDAYEMNITESGGVRIKDLELGQEIPGVGAYRFEGDQLLLDSDVCLRWEGGFAIEFACQATYTVYLVTDGDNIVGIRFEEIEDPYRDRRLVLIENLWQPFEE